MIEQEPSPSPLPAHVIKLIPPAQWADLCQTGFVPWSDLDKADGFMHLSTEAQMIETANRYYTDHPIVLGLKIRHIQIEPNLKWEPAAKRNNALFPHLYAQCPRTAIDTLLILERDAQNRFLVSDMLAPTISPDTFDVKD